MGKKLCGRSMALVQFACHVLDSMYLIPILSAKSPASLSFIVPAPHTTLLVSAYRGLSVQARRLVDLMKNDTVSLGEVPQI